MGQWRGPAFILEGNPLNSRKRLLSAAATALATCLALPGTATAASGATASSGSAQKTTTASASVTQAVGIESSLWTGDGFDTCSAPSESAMAQWREYSPYDAIGIYIGGSGLACTQPNLTPQWVEVEAAAGWHFSLNYAGPQPASANCQSCGVITDPAPQAAAAAQDAVARAASLGFQPGLPILYDMRDYTRGGSDSATVLSFLSDWSADLTAMGYVPGVAGGMSSTVADLVANYSNTAYHIPQVIDFASEDGAQSTADTSIPAADWNQQQRINQYESAHTEKWGSATLTVGSDYLDYQYATGETASARVYRLGANKQSVQEHVSGTTWLTIGGPASAIYVSYDDVFAVSPSGQGIFEFDPSLGSWTRIGGAAAQFATVEGELFGLGPNRSYVAEWSGGTWHVVGGAASAIYGGAFQLVATNPDNTAAYMFDALNRPAGSWTLIGGGAASFIGNSYKYGYTLYALAKDHSYVAKWSGSGTDWTVIGGAAQNIYGNTLQDGSLFAAAPGDDGVYEYQGTTSKWTRIGGAGAQFSAGDAGLYGLTSLNGDVYQYDPDGGTWADLGGPAAAIVTGIG